MISGSPAVALMPPPFFPLSQDDILAFFLHVAEAVDLPVMFYNFSELCGKRIDLATIAACADRAPMCAIKQSGGEFAYHRELIAIGREKNSLSCPAPIRACLRSSNSARPAASVASSTSCPN